MTRRDVPRRDAGREAAGTAGLPKHLRNPWPVPPAPDLTKSVWSSYEVAGFLGVGEPTVTRMWRQGLLPGRKVGKQTRFLRSVVEDWLAAGDRTPHEFDKDDDHLDDSGAPR